MAMNHVPINAGLIRYSVNQNDAAKSRRRFLTPGLKSIRARIIHRIDDDPMRSWTKKKIVETDQHRHKLPLDF
jgi:hypothetical protein